MHIGMIFLVSCALGWWIGTAYKRNQRRRRTAQEIEHALETGMPKPDTSVGQRAEQVSQAEEQTLREPPAIHGTARWAIREDATGLLTDWSYGSPSKCLCLGNLIENGAETGNALAASYPGHILTVAGTGQGKSATQIIANLMTYAASVVVLDPKGELYEATAHKRRQFGPVYRLDPFGPQFATDHYNPMHELGSERERGARARQLAEMLIVRQGDKGAANAAFFENEAINLLTAVILFVVERTEENERERRTLAHVFEILSLPLLGNRKTREDETDYLDDYFGFMAKGGKNPMVRQTGKAFRGYDHKLLASFVSEINSNLAFFAGHPGFGEVTSHHDFNFADLAKRPATVYLTIPLKQLATSYRFLRMMIGAAFGALEEQREAREASVLFVLDEFPALKDMEFMREAVAQMRSSGAWFWFFVQDVAQLEAIYGDSANIFLSQTDHQVFFGATVDEKTKRHISTTLGVSTFSYREPSVTWSHSVGANESDNAHPIQIPGSGHGRNVGQSVNIAAPIKLAPRPLLTPFEVGTFLSERLPGERHATRSIIFSKAAGGFPIQARRTHWKELEAQAIPALQLVGQLK